MTRVSVSGSMTPSRPSSTPGATGRAMHPWARAPRPVFCAVSASGSGAKNETARIEGQAVRFSGRARQVRYRAMPPRLISPARASIADWSVSSGNGAPGRRLGAGPVGLGEPPDVMRTAGLRTGAGEAFAAERLRADHRADLVAVDVDVADVKVLDDVLNPVVDPRMQPERQAVSGGIDGFDDVIRSRSAAKVAMWSTGPKISSSTSAMDETPSTRSARRSGRRRAHGKLLQDGPGLPRAIDVGWRFSAVTRCR